MTESTESDLLHQVWEYPLFDALFGRRSRRFGLGFEMTEGPFKYKSQRVSLPLSDLEEAVLIAAGIGFSWNCTLGSEPPTSVPRRRGPDIPQHIAWPPYRIVLHQ